MLTEIIDKFYQSKARDREQHHFYISDAGKCARAVFFKFKSAPAEKMDGRVLRIFEHGDYMHQLVMKALFGTREVHVVASEVNVPPQEIISGRADAILSVNNELYVLDIKSMNSMIFKNMTQPKPENVNQLQLYLHYFNVKKGILLYIDKDKQELKDFIIEYDPEISQQLLNDFKQLKDKIDSDIIPQTLFDYPDNWQCSYCQFREICDRAGKDEFSWPKFKAQLQQQQNLNV